MKTGVYGFTPEKYLADDVGCDVPCLSSSVAHTLDRSSPMHAHARHPKLGGRPPRHSDAFDLGNAAHAMLLGTGKEIVVVQAADWRTKAAKEERDAARAAGQVAMLSRQFDDAVKTANRLRDAFKRQGVSLDGEPEQVILWVEHADDGTPVQCKAMLDLVDFATGRIRDLKSTKNANPAKLNGPVDDYGYAVQDAAYRRAVEAARPQLVGRTDFAFAFFELEQPHGVCEARLDGAWRELGNARWRRAVNTWARCLRTGVWPGYGPALLTPPPWVLNRDLERAAEEGEDAPEAESDDESEAA